MAIILICWSKTQLTQQIAMYAVQGCYLSDVLGRGNGQRLCVPWTLEQHNKLLTGMCQHSRLCCGIMILWGRFERLFASTKYAHSYQPTSVALP